MVHFNTDQLEAFKRAKSNIPSVVLENLESRKKVVESVKRRQAAYEKIPVRAFENIESYKRASLIYKNLPPEVLKYAEAMHSNVNLAKKFTQTVGKNLNGIQSSLNAYNNIPISYLSNAQVVKAALARHQKFMNDAPTNLKLVKFGRETYNADPSEMVNTIPEIYRYSNEFQTPEMGRVIRGIVPNDDKEAVEITDEKEEEIPLNVASTVYVEWVLILFPILYCFWSVGFDSDEAVRKLLEFIVSSNYPRNDKSKKED